MSAVPMQKNRLGRGLASLIGEPQTSGERPQLPPEGTQRVVAVDQIRAGKMNPRRDYAQVELEELADSIQRNGLVQPIIVRAATDGEPGYEIVAGERRWRAAQMAGVHQVPCIIRMLDDQQALEMAIIENVQRTDLNAIEEAGGYRELMERFGYTQDKLAEVIGKSRSHLANTLRLLKLPDLVQTMVRDGQLTPGHARALVGRDDAEELARLVVENDLNVREVEALVQRRDEADEKDDLRQITVREKDADTKMFERQLTESLGLKVEVKRGSGESGSLVIKYGNYEQLDYIKQRLTGE